MKFIVSITFIALVHSAHALKSVGVSFGPQNCVSLTRSTSGSCVFSTNCEGSDTSSTEFAFDCIGENGKGDVVRHSFGVGGFESNEEFDSDVKCGRCATVSHENEYLTAPQPPKAQPKHQEIVPGAVGLKAKATTAVKQEHKAKASTAVEQQATFWPFSGGKKPKGDSAAVKYGPADCVSTWKSAEGHCMMATDCKKADIANYEFGLVCVDKTGSPVKHLFGKGSFDEKETFDTLVKCDKCLGHEDIPDSVALAGEVASMAKSVGDLKDMMKDISKNVNMLNKAVFKAGPAPGPAAAGPAPAAPAKPAAKPAKFFAHGAVNHHKHHHGNLRHSHRHHRREEDDDEDQDDEDDRRDDNDDEGWEEEHQTAEQAVDKINAAAVKLQQDQAAQAAEQQRVQYVPMSTASTDTNKASTRPTTRADDDDDDSDSYHSSTADSINAAAVRLQQAQAAQAAEQARVQYVPMSAVSTDTNKASVQPAAEQQSDDADDDGDAESDED